MDNSSIQNTNAGEKITQILGVILRLAGIYFLGFGVLYLLFRFLFHTDLAQIGKIIGSDISKDQKQNLLIMVQTFAPLIQFILFPILYVFLYKKELYTVFILKSWKPALFLLFSLFAYFSFLPALETIVQWNQNLHLPEGLSFLEQQMVDMEEKAKEMTEILISYDTKGRFFLILLVVAVLPAIGEEIFFRGLLQNEVKNITGNYHFAVWFTAIAFSFIHFQFFGFVPRMLLGALFGYVYVWSGNILIPIALHFFNNAATLILSHGLGDTANETEQASVPLFFAIVSTVFTVIIIYYLHKLYRERLSHESE